MRMPNISLDLTPKEPITVNLPPRFHTTPLLWKFVNGLLAEHPHAHPRIHPIPDNPGILLKDNVHEDLHLLEETQHFDRFCYLVSSDSVTGIELSHLHHIRMQLFLVVVVRKIGEGSLLRTIYLYLVRIFESHSSEVWMDGLNKLYNCRKNHHLIL